MMAQVSVVVTPSLVGLLAVGWIAGVLLALLGRRSGNAGMAAAGLVIVGLMFPVTGLTRYVYVLLVELGALGPGDLILLAALAFAGGTVASLGLRLPRARLGAAGKR